MMKNYRDIVHKLMRQADDETAQGNEAGAQSYVEKAAALAVKFGVEYALEESYNEAPSKIVLKKVLMSNPYPKHRISLLSVIAKHMSCKVLKSGRNLAELFGDEQDVERVMFVYRLVSTHMLGAVAQARPEVPEYEIEKHFYFKTTGLTPAEVKSFRVSWVIGYIAGIYTRMQESYKVTVEEAKGAGKPGAALVLADRRALVERHVAETYPNLRKAPRTRVTNRAAFSAGMSAADEADLGRPGIENRKAIAG